MARDRKFVTMYRTQRTTVIDVDMASTKTLNECSAWSGDVYGLPVRRCAKLTGQLGQVYDKPIKATRPHVNTPCP